MHPPDHGSPCQLSESTRPNGIFPILETPDGTLGNARPAEEDLSGKLFCFRPGFLPDISHRLLFRTRGRFHVSGPGFRLRPSLIDRTRSLTASRAPCRCTATAPR